MTEPTDQDRIGLLRGMATMTSLDRFERDAISAGAAALELKAELVEVLKRYERWEADLLLADEAWREASTPRVPQRLWDELVEIQGLRNRTLEKATP